MTTKVTVTFELTQARHALELLYADAFRIRQLIEHATSRGERGPGMQALKDCYDSVRGLAAAIEAGFSPAVGVSVPNA